MTNQNRYAQIIESIFFSKFKKGNTEIIFKREDIEINAKKLGITLPKNLGDLIYSFRYRAYLPESIQKEASKGKTWVIRPAGRSIYKFCAVNVVNIFPNEHLAETKIADSTPGMVEKYALSDEQSLLAKVRYNRLLDIFTGITCFSLQNHLRTTVPDIGQIEIDELYVGVDTKGIHYIFPIQAKGGKDKLNIVQIEQDYAFCEDRFKDLICIPIATQFVADDLIAVFSFEKIKGELKIINERHYRLVEPNEIRPSDLHLYQKRH